MSIEHITDDIYADSFPADIADKSSAMERDGFRNPHARIDRGLHDEDARDRERVYRHSIGRFSKLRQLQSRGKAG